MLMLVLARSSLTDFNSGSTPCAPLKTGGMGTNPNPLRFL